MQILITNDDGYSAKGLATLVKMAQKWGDVTVVAPKSPQSGMGMAVNLGIKRLAYRDLGTRDGVKWSYLDATPASCVKFGLYSMSTRPDLILSGINHGSNATTGACYSGTLGACQEGTINGIPSIGVSLATGKADADFSAVEKYFPEIFRKLMAGLPAPKGVYYNVNFPVLPPEEIKGVRVTTMGIGHWIKEFTGWDPDLIRKDGIARQGAPMLFPEPEEGEVMYMMRGDYVDDADNGPLADNHAMADGYIAVTALNVFNADREEEARLRAGGLDEDFRA